MSRLANRTALVAGGAGNVGEGIVRAFLNDGATVAVPSRSAEKLDDLRARLGHDVSDRLISLVGDVGDPEDARRLRDELLDDADHIDDVVASLGSWWQGAPVTDVPMDAWETVLTNNLRSHIVVARTLLPVLVDQGHGSYTFITGSAAETPVANAGPTSVVAAAQRMLSRTLMKESSESGVRINTLMINTPVITRSRPDGKPHWLTADDVGHFAAWLASEEAEMINGNVIPLSAKAVMPEQNGAAS